MNWRRVIQVVVAVCVTMGSFTASASAATTGPGWKSFATSLPTNFAPGAEAGEAIPTAAFPQYSIGLVNVGGAEAMGPIQVVNVLPVGITPSTAAPPAWRVNSQIQGGSPAEEPCAIAGQTVTCTIMENILPGRELEVRIPVNVSSSPLDPILEDSFEVSGGGAAPMAGSISTLISREIAHFGFLPGSAGLSGGAVAESGGSATLAGSHPYSVILSAGFPSREKPAKEELLTAGSVRDLSFSLPPGLVADPQATPVLCTEAELVASETDPAESCPPSSQVGTVNTSLVSLDGGSLVGNPLYNMVPPPGVPAEFGFNLVGTVVHAMGGVDGGFHLTTSSSDILAKVPVGGIIAELWGDPSDPRHDSSRRGVGCFTLAGCSVEQSKAAFLSLPSACSTSLELGAMTSSWEDSTPLSGSVAFGGPNSEPTAIEGCESLQFAPTINVQATSSAASSPTGLSVRLHLPQNEGVRGRATATLKKVSVQLPQGITINSAAADGLGACSPAQIDVGGSQPPSCPDSSKVGSAEIATPLLKSPLRGSIYLAEQGNNPFGTLLALYLVAEGEGVVLKLPGRVDADPTTGRLTATFDDNPQLPFSDLEVDFNSGSRATLTTPAACGSYNVRSELTSWASSTPVVVNSPIRIESECAAASFNPSFSAGTSNPVAGSYSPFLLRVTRSDGEQNLSGISTTLPEGLLARLSDIPLCPDSAATSGACPSSSQIGTTTTGVGVGTQPLYIPQPGKAPTAVYLSGPYKGAPYSLVIKVPAQAGPFDLGTIAVRAALNVDPYTARVTAVSDPLPQILQGIPIAYRDIRVNIDRGGFVLNPTSCDPMKIESRLISVTGASATPNDHFQVGGCEALKFKPELRVSLAGSTRRTGHPALKAVLTYPKKGTFANISRAQVNLPHSEFLDQGNLNKTCTKPVLEAGNCPKSSAYGKAKAWTPLLERPLEGPVYLVGGFGYKLPALVADLNGQLRILLKSKVDTGPNKGIRDTFEAVPDAPVSRFVLEMKGGKRYSLLENSEDLCKRKQVGAAAFKAQNGKTLNLTPVITNSCKSGSKAKNNNKK